MSNESDTVLEVEGMTCPSCVRHVSTALTALVGVAKVDVKLRDGLVVVKHDATQAPIDRLVAALADAGYPSK
jgi:copper chaperone